MEKHRQKMREESRWPTTGSFEGAIALQGWSGMMVTPRRKTDDPSHASTGHRSHAGDSITPRKAFWPGPVEVFARLAFAKIRVLM
jgi:hypothetical protein